MNKKTREAHRADQTRTVLVLLGLVAVASLCVFAYSRGLSWGSIWSGRIAFQQELENQALSKIQGRVLIHAESQGRSTESEVNILLIVAPLDARLETRPHPDDIFMSMSDPGAKDRLLSGFRQAGGEIRWLHSGERFEILIRNSDEIVLIAVSDMATASEPTREDLAMVGRYVIPAYDLLNGRRYRIQKLSAMPSNFLTIEF